MKAGWAYGSRDAGADEKLAEVMTTGVSEAWGDLVTKADLTEPKESLTDRIYGLVALIVFAVLIRPYLPLP